MTDAVDTKNKPKRTRSTKGTRKRQSRGTRKKETPENAPIFLRKTYHMIDTCDPTIATWSDDGLAFVVKDIEKFAAEILGQFFKHNNFSSFVRQLNFYGFRKIKSDPLRITDAENDIESKYWKFRHEKFQRGRPDLLTEIRKTNHNETAEKTDVDTLKSEIKNLKNRVASMSREMERMASIVANVMQNQHLQSKTASLQTAAQPSAEPPSKKRKSVAPPPPPSPLPLSIPSNPTSNVDVDQLDDISVDLDIFAPPPKVAPTPFGGSRQASGASFTSTDEEILSSLFALDSADNVDTMKQKHMQDYLFPEKSVGDVEKPSANTSGEDLDPTQVTRLKNALSVLPKNLQQMFVDRIVAFVVDPVSFKKQVDAVSALAVAAATEANNRVATSSADQSQINELASAILGAWLTRYQSTETRDNTPVASAPIQSPIPPETSVPPEVDLTDPLRAPSVSLDRIMPEPSPPLAAEQPDLLLDAL